jgi:hypothetical protein
METKDNLAIRFKKLCNLVAVINSQKKSTYSSHPNGVEAIRLLKALCNDFIKKSDPLENLTIYPHISKGKGSLPRVLWLAFTLQGKPSSNICAAMCFDKFGKGAVMGVMDSVSNPNYTLNTVKRKTKEITPLINVDGPPYSDAQYANKFLNPKEFFLEKFDTNEMIEHYKSSIKILSNYY